MPIHPQVRAVLEQRASRQQPSYSSLDVADFRAGFEVPTPFALRAFDGEIDDRVILTDAGTLGLRIYSPRRAGPATITLYLHGGGFVLGGTAITEGICCALASRAETVVVSVDYAVAPECPFPHALDEARAALAWVERHAEALGGARDRIAVAGDSSGGNLAAAVAQASRVDGPRLCHQLLFYPVLDCSNFETESYRAFAEGFLLTRDMMRWFVRQYLPDPALSLLPRASPAREADLRGVPSATIVTAEYDVLRDEGEAYARALRAAGVEVGLRRWDGQIHGFLLMQGAVDAADTALDAAGDALREAFAHGGAQ